MAGCRDERMDVNRGTKTKNQRLNDKLIDELMISCRCHRVGQQHQVKCTTLFMEDSGVCVSLCKLPFYH